MAAKPKLHPNRTLWRTAGPGVRPITLEQAKQQLRLDPSDTIWDDEVIEKLDASVERVEHDTEKVLITQTFESRAFCFPDSYEGYSLDRDPILTVSEVKYIAQGGSGYTTLASYLYDEGRRALFPTGEPWPATETNHPQAVVVTFDAGYGAGAASVPRQLLEAVLVSLIQLFHGEDVEQNYQDLIRPHRRSSYP